MRQSTFDRLNIFPLVLDDPVMATLACNKICVADLIAQAQAEFLEDTGKPLTLAQAITLIDDQVQIAQEAHYWAGVTLRTVTIRGIDENGDPETTKFVLTFDGTTFAMTQYRAGEDVDGWNMAHSLAEVNEQLESQAAAVRSLYKTRKDARADARPRKARSPRKDAPRPIVHEVTA